MFIDLPLQRYMRESQGLIALLFFNFCLLSVTSAGSPEPVIEDAILVQGQLFSDTPIISPSTLIDDIDIQSVNVSTVEDILSYAPNLIVRKRYIGDANGVIGIRGSNMFQGARTSVYLDGMPIHYHLQTRFSGSPRWSLAPAPEIASAEVLYGPYSAEYGGGAMGGVVNLETKPIQDGLTRAQFSLYSQDYDILATDEQYSGSRIYLSHEERFAALGLRFGYLRLDNNSQPMTQYLTTDIEGFEENQSQVNGAIRGRDAKNQPAIYYGDSGPENALTDLFSLKSDYKLTNGTLRAHIAFEERSRNQDQPNNFLRNNEGDTVWFGGSNFQHREQQRNSLLVGLGANYQLQSGWEADGFISYFNILKDRGIRSARDPQDPDYLAQNEAFRGRLTQFNRTSWKIVEAKLGTMRLFNSENLRLSLGLHADEYDLGVRSFNYNSVANERGSLRNNDRGRTQNFALYSQFGWKFYSNWDASLGVRAERWKAEGIARAEEETSQDDTALSPKYSLAYTNFLAGELRYSLARAVRFPIVEELYRNESSLAQETGSVFLGDPNLRPEEGVFQNLSYTLEGSLWRLRANLFFDEIDDVIFNSSTIVINTDDTQSSVTTSLPVSTVRTQGVEVALDWREIAKSNLSVIANVSYTDARVTDNVLDPSIKEKQFPRVPYWRANINTRYDFNQNFFTSLGLRYASNSFGSLDNSDIASGVFGAHDEYLFVSTKASWKLNKRFRAELGIDNIFDKTAYVFHPWPGRSYSFTLSAEFE